MQIKYRNRNPPFAVVAQSFCNTYNFILVSVIHVKRLRAYLFCNPLEIEITAFMAGKLQWRVLRLLIIAHALTGLAHSGRYLIEQGLR